MHDRNGVLTGSVVAVLDLHHLDSMWSRIDLGTDGTIVLLRRDGSMLLRVPHTESAMGKNFGHLPVFRTLLPASEVGNYRVRGAVDGVPRLFAYGALAAHPDLVVVVGRSRVPRPGAVATVGFHRSMGLGHWDDADRGALCNPASGLAAHHPCATFCTA